jgi:hypothetical protein
MKMTEEYGLNHMGENNDDDDEDDDDDEGNTVAPPAPAPAVMPKEIMEEEALWKWFLSKRPLWRMR